MTISKINILVFFLYVIAQASFAGEIQFERLMADKGLSTDNITSIQQDSKGYLWIGTSNGVNRYDGYSFKVYRHVINDSNSLSANTINKLFIDSKDNLWIGTHGGGLNLYSYENDNFIRYTQNHENKNRRVGDNRIWDINEDENGTLWVVSSANITIIDQLHASPFLFMDSIHDFFNTHDVGPKTIAIKNDTLVIGSWNDGLIILNRKNDSIERIYNNKKTYADQVIEDNSINKVKVIKNNIWVGTWNHGLYIITHEGQIYHYKSGNKENNISNNKITDIFEDKQGKIWIGTTEGLNRVTDKKNIGQLSFEQYYSDRYNIHTLSNNNINNIFQDQTGVLWFATSNGLDKYYPNKIKFNYFTKAEDRLTNSDVTSFSYISPEKILIGTWGGGVNIFNPLTKEFSSFPDIPSKEISKIKKNQTGKIIVCSKNEGIYIIDQNNNKISNYTINDTDNWVNDVLYDKKETLWIAKNNGLYKVKNNKSERVNTDNKRLKYITCIIEDMLGNIWIAEKYGGLFVYDSNDGKIRQIISSSQQQGEIFYLQEDSHNHVWALSLHGKISKVNINTLKVNFYDYTGNTMQEDENGSIWIGSTFGLIQYDPASENFISSFTEDDGLSNNNVKSLEIDKNGNFWIGTDFGLSWFNPLTEEFKTFDASDGITDYSFSTSRSFKTQNNLILFATSNGFISFYPDSIQYNKQEPALVFSNLTIFNQTINVNQKYNDRIILPVALNELPELILTHKEYIFSIEFAALDFVAPEKNQYMYKLEGFEQEWTTTHSNKVSYTNLSPGEYTFMVRGANNDGVWNNEVNYLKIKILPPFYATLWFKFIIGIALILLAIAYYINKVRSVKLLNEKLNKQVKQRTFELHIQKEELKTLNDSKDKLFSIIGHDLKNPFNAISVLAGELQEGFHKMDDRKKEEILELIKESAINANQLLDNLLHWSEANTNKIKFEKETLDVNEVVHNVIQYFKPNAKTKVIQIFAENKSLDLSADKDMLKTIIRNLVGNAIKYTKEKGEIHIQYNQKDSHVEIVIKDKGVGIPEEALQHLFDVSKHYVTPGTKGETGTGLGLVLCKEFMEMHNGSIHVDSKENEGTIVSILFPM